MQSRLFYFMINTERGEWIMSPRGVSAIKQAAAEGAFEGAQAGIQTPRNRDEEELERLGLGEEESRLQSLLTTIPKDGASYIKIYKMSPLPEGQKKPIFKKEIMDLSEIIDLELHIRDMAIESDWGPGQYLVMPFMRDPETGKVIRGVYATPVKFYLDYEKPKQPTGLMSNLGQVKEVVDMVHAISPQQSNSPGDMSKAITDTVKTTIDIMKESRGGDGRDSNTNLLKTVEMLKEVGVIKEHGEEKKEDSQSSLREMLVLLKELGIVGQPKQDIIGEIIKYREAGLIAQPVSNDVLSDVNKLKSLIDLLSPILSPPTEKPSMLVEIAKIVGPQLPDVIKNITEGIRDAKELFIQTRLMKAGMKPQITRQPVPQVAIAQPTSEEVQPTEATQTQPTGPTVSRDPIWIEIYKAVESRDSTFFPKLKGRMLFFMGQEQYDNLIDGVVPPETLLELAATRAGTFLLTPEAKQYFADFMQWEKKNEEAMITGECIKCHELYQYKTQQDFDEDGKKCDCGGEIQLQKEEQAA